MHILENSFPLQCDLRIFLIMIFTLFQLSSTNRKSTSVYFPKFYQKAFFNFLKHRFVCNSPREELFLSQQKIHAMFRGILALYNSVNSMKTSKQEKTQLFLVFLKIFVDKLRQWRIQRTQGTTLNPEKVLDPQLQSIEFIHIYSMQDSFFSGTH